MSRTPRRVMTDDEKDEIAKRYRAGETILALSIALEFSPCAIRAALIARGVSRRPACGRGRSRLNFNPERRC